MSLRAGFPKYYEKWTEISNLRAAVEKHTTGKVMILSNHILALKIADQVVGVRQCSECPIKDIVHLVAQWRSRVAQA